MIQNHNNVTSLAAFASVEPENCNRGADIKLDGVETNITEDAVQQALREMESVWMKHHNHYADVLESLMQTVKAARGVV